MHSNKPLIGITLSQALEADNYRWPMRREFDYQSKYYHYAVENAGGIPFGLFNTDSEKIIDQYLVSVDGIIFTGGPDINARLFGQKHYHLSTRPTDLRDRFELALLRKAIRMKKSLFCICRGHQLLNIALGGDLYQDIRLYGKDTLRHTPLKSGIDAEHIVRLENNSLIYRILQKERIKVNSSHHQVIKNLGRNLKIAARSPDGVIEAIGLVDYPFLLSVQWHPERIFRRVHARLLFAAFIEAASRRNRL